MDNNDFIKEAHDYLDNRYLLFKSYQSTVMDTLVAFDSVCQKAGIEYVLAFGNLIGAIRDNSVQLPWDYDIDVTVSYDNKEKLLESLEEYLPEDYYYAYNNNIEKYPAPCLRVCKKGCTWLALHVDVFFVVGLPDNGKEQRQVIKKIRKLSAAKEAKYYKVHMPEKNLGFLKQMLLSVYTVMKYGMCSGYQLEDYLDKYVKRHPMQNSTFVMPVGTISTIKWKKEWMQPHRVDLKEGAFPIPTSYDDMLRPIFGDYMSYTPIKSRFDEFYHICDIVERRQKKYEMS